MQFGCQFQIMMRMCRSHLTQPLQSIATLFNPGLAKFRFIRLREQYTPVVEISDSVAFLYQLARGTLSLRIFLQQLQPVSYQVLVVSRPCFIYWAMSLPEPWGSNNLVVNRVAIWARLRVKSTK